MRLKWLVKKIKHKKIKALSLHREWLMMEERCASGEAPSRADTHLHTPQMWRPEADVPRRVWPTLCGKEDRNNQLPYSTEREKLSRAYQLGENTFWRMDTETGRTEQQWQMSRFQMPPSEDKNKWRAIGKAEEIMLLAKTISSGSMLSLVS